MYRNIFGWKSHTTWTYAGQKIVWDSNDVVDGDSFNMTLMYRVKIATC